MSTPTRLQLFACDGYNPFNEDFVFSHALKTIVQLRGACGYTFDLPMPVNLKVERTAKTKTVDKWFGRGTKEVEDEVVYAYYLVFDRELTEAELSLWCMFKMGWRSARWPRY